MTMYFMYKSIKIYMLEPGGIASTWLGSGRYNTIVEKTQWHQYAVVENPASFASKG